MKIDKEFADHMNRLTPEQIARAMETMPTAALEAGVKFEALEHKACPHCGGEGSFHHLSCPYLKVLFT